MLVGAWARCRDATRAINHAWVIGAYASAPLRLTNMAELFSLSTSIQGNIAVLVLSVSRITVSICVLVEFTLTESIFNAFDIFVNGILSAGHTNVIDMFGREQVIARL
eukprot:3815101-Pyramimonas_sp.AAC.1